MPLADPATFFATPRASFKVNNYRSGTSASAPPASTASASAASPQVDEEVQGPTYLEPPSVVNTGAANIGPVTPLDQRSITTGRSNRGSTTPKALADKENGSQTSSSTFLAMLFSGSVTSKFHQWSRVNIDNHLHHLLRQGSRSIFHLCTSAVFFEPIY